MEDVIIVGGGIIGLATGFKILEANPDLKVRILEKESSIARHQTGNNSGVIHSGLYYKPGSAKAKNCVHGYKLLVDFATEYNIDHEICGKIVVATLENELPRLKKLQETGAQNGLAGIKELQAEELKEYEPYVSGLAGLFVPQTGIIDYKEVSRKLQALFENAGGSISFNSKFTGVKNQSQSIVILTTSGEFESNYLINCAGLYSDKVAHATDAAHDLKIVPFRGEYYELRKDREHLVKNLIYPVPDPSFPFLGVHYTRMIGGGVEAGPNAVLAFAREGYKKSDIELKEFLESLSWPGFQKVAFKYWKTGFGEVYRSFSKAAFTRSLQRLIPEIESKDLIPGGAGVRAQACDRNGGLLDDFAIYESEKIINVCNAPSPAATSSLSIGETISKMLLARTG